MQTGERTAVLKSTVVLGNYSAKGPQQKAEEIFLSHASKNSEVTSQDLSQRDS
jgi:hypothetical protein